MIIAALEAARKFQDISKFLEAANVYVKTCTCTEGAITGGSWYTLKGGCTNYNICPRCYTGFIDIWGAGQYFEVAPTSGSTDAIVCNNSPKAPRFLQFANLNLEGQEQGDYTTIFVDNVRKLINVAECPRDNDVEGLIWYGWEDCLICKDCFESYCKPTAHKLDMTCNDSLITEKRMCCMYSPRMRGKWAEACEKGDATELIEFSRHRHRIYQQTVPQMRMLREMQQLQMMSAMSSGFASILYQGAHGIQSVSGATDGYLHGNNSIGWHETENGATSAQLFNDMNSGFNAAQSGGTWGQIFQLAAAWDQVA